MTSTTDIFLTVIHHLVSNSSSSNPIKMSSTIIAPSARYAVYRSEHASLGHRITFDYSLSSPAPMHEGRTSGYFDDSATHTLLGLKEDDLIMHLGTYGLKEPGAEPVDLSLLRDGSFNQRLLPFAPIHVSTFLPLILHELNRQPYPKKALVKALKEDVDWSLDEASDLGSRVGLSLLAYVHEVLTILLCEDPENLDPFAYQLCPYFPPSVLRIRWTRINHRKIMLHAFINLCHHILHPSEEWKVRPPVGIQVDSTVIDETTLSLVHAYLFFGIPVTGLALELPENYSVKSARDALLDPQSQKAPLVVELEHVIQLPEGSDDAPTFKNLHPQYDTLVYGDDGVKLTAKERRLLHLYEDDGDMTLLPDPKPAKDKVPLASHLDVPPRNSPNAALSMSALATPSTLTMVPFSSRLDSLSGDNPYSASSTSTSITDSFSSSTSASCRKPSGSDSFGPVCPARSNARS